MHQYRSWLSLATLAFGLCLALASTATAREVERPEEIKSKRQVVYDTDTYGRLERLWKDYNDAYPSEFAYANWMYAARYAGDDKYPDLLDAGLEQYPSNPTLLYLKSMLTDDADATRKYLERAIAIDPTFTDPWFSLAVEYMRSGDEEKVDLALRHLLESGTIADEIMDYNYNVLVGLEPNAILVTNGDNDTYPAWILTRILGVRSDITIVNRSLLNTDWYPVYLLEHDFPRYIGKSELDNLRKTIVREMEQKKAAPPPGGAFGDTLILRTIDSATRAGRPVYFAKTVYITDKLRSAAEQGRDLCLTTLVTPSQTSYGAQLERLCSTWIDSFRTAGLQSWRLRNQKRTDAGQFIVTNYAFALVGSLPQLKEDAPSLRAPLFRWYTMYVDELLSEDYRSKVANAWCCGASDVSEVKEWCQSQGLKCENGK